MSRDHRKLRVFALADGLVIDVYRITGAFPTTERYSLQAQIRRAAVSAASNIVEGSARATTSEYLHFLNVAAGSAAEAGYLLTVASRLSLLEEADRRSLSDRYSELSASLQALIRALRPHRREPKPEP